MNRQKGFTLTEILVTLVIFAVITGIAVPGLVKSKEKAAANQAIAYLRTIRAGQRRYFAKWGTYVSTPGCGIAPCSSPSDIKLLFGAEVLSDYYDWDVRATDSTHFNAKAFLHTDTSKWVCLDQNGGWTASATFTFKPATSD